MGQDHQLLIWYMDIEVQWDVSLSSGDPTLHGVSKVTAAYHSVRETTVRGAQRMCW